jgi:hypothetical protein
MGSRDRPHREAKKKPKDKTGLPKVQPMMEPPMPVGDEEQADEG